MGSHRLDCLHGFLSEREFGKAGGDKVNLEFEEKNLRYESTSSGACREVNFL